MINGVAYTFRRICARESVAGSRRSTTPQRRVGSRDVIRRKALAQFTPRRFQALFTSARKARYFRISVTRGGKMIPKFHKRSTRGADKSLARPGRK